MNDFRPGSVRRAPANSVLCALLALCSSGAASLAQTAAVHDHGAHHDVAHPAVPKASPEAHHGLGDLSENQPESNKKMAALIQAVFRSTDPRENVYKPHDYLALLKAEIEQPPPGADLINLRLRHAVTLVDLGESKEGLAAFDALQRTISTSDSAINPRFQLALMCSRGMANLRIGEQENCLTNHNAESCLLPIRGGGIHRAKAGSQAAVHIFSELLTQFPGDVRAQWLLNIAYMTLGEYPAGVPRQWLIDPQVFESEYPLPRFVDVAADLGLSENDLAGGVVMEDFDHDGNLDLMISGWGMQSQMRLFRNNGDGTFEERTKQAGMLGLVSGLNMIHGDYNNDGHHDVLVLRGAWLGPLGKYPNSLLRNNGDFTFTDVTEEAGLLSFHPTQAAAWLDYDSDGDLDIFVGNESRDATDPNACELYRNNGNGTFTECAAEHGLNFIDFVKGVTSADYNNDGRPDFFISSRSGTRRLLRNDGPATDSCTLNPKWSFKEVSEEAGVGRRHRSFPCWFFDYNNDGWEDLMVTGYAIQDVGDIAADYIGLPTTGERARLFRNNGNGSFSDVSRDAGVARVLHTMGCNFGDLDNDGWLDFYVGTGDPDYSTLIPNRMFRNNGSGRFQDVTTAGGFGQIQKGHAIAFGDIDNDGDQDVYSNVGGALAGDRYPNQLFQNPGNANRWLKLSLAGTQSNRIALGARIRILVRSGKTERAIYRTVTTGASFGSATLRQEIGLGSADAEVVRVDVFWPTSGQRQTFTNLLHNRYYRITEGSDVAEEVSIKAIAFPKSHGAHRHDHAVTTPARQADRIAGVSRVALTQH